MEFKEYTAKNGETQLKPSAATLEELVQDDLGFCLACGETQSTEPDAVRYECECCGEAKVYGATELLLRGIFY